MNPITESIDHEFIVEAEAGLRLDQALSRQLPQYSRNLIKTWIEKGEVTLNGQQKRPATLLKQGDKVIVKAIIENQKPTLAEEIPLEIIYEDDDVLVVHKKAGMVVHPAAGHYEGTLVNAILHHAPQSQLLPRGGIIHRLDKETSGLLLIAKTLAAHTFLVAEMQKRHIERYYQTVVIGHIIGSGTIDKPIGRHSLHRQKMAIASNGKPAVTHYKILQKFPQFTHLDVKLETGRTHQIRVHFASINHPIIGDTTYGRSLKNSKFPDDIKLFPRQALHAYKLEFTHPVTRKKLSFEIPLPDDITKLLAALKKFSYD